MAGCCFSVFYHMFCVLHAFCSVFPCQAHTIPASLPGISAMPGQIRTRAIAASPAGTDPHLRYTNIPAGTDPCKRYSSIPAETNRRTRYTSIPARTMLATIPASVESNAPFKVYLVFVTLAARK